jgi:purine-binding chemotaxis protein CheW
MVQIEQQIVIFRLGDEEYAVPILQIQEIVRLPEKITFVPNVPNFIKGVMNLRGEILPIVDLHERFNIKKLQEKEKVRIIVTRIENQLVGIIVDEVVEVMNITKEQVSIVPEMFTQIDYEYLSGIVKLKDRLIIMLDLPKLFSDIEKEILEWTTKKIKLQQEELKKEYQSKAVDSK